MATPLSLPIPYRRTTAGPDSFWYSNDDGTAYADDKAACAAVPAAVRVYRTVNVAGTEKWWLTDTTDAGLKIKVNVGFVTFVLSYGAALIRNIPATTLLRELISGAVFRTKVDNYTLNPLNLLESLLTGGISLEARGVVYESVPFNAAAGRSISDFLTGLVRVKLLAGSFYTVARQATDQVGWAPAGTTTTFRFVDNYGDIAFNPASIDVAPRYRKDGTTQEIVVRSIGVAKWQLISDGMGPVGTSSGPSTTTTALYSSTALYAYPDTVQYDTPAGYTGGIKFWRWNNPADTVAATRPVPVSATNVPQGSWTEVSASFSGTLYTDLGQNTNGGITQKRVTDALETKVDNVAGKGLSTNDYTSAESSKLAGIAAGATANSPDAMLLARNNHTGTQPASTVTGLAAVATSGAYNDLTGKPAPAPLNTDGLPEGATNVYATPVRTLATLLTGYVRAATTRAIAATDSILTALGLLEKKADDNTGRIATLELAGGDLKDYRALRVKLDRTRIYYSKISTTAGANDDAIRQALSDAQPGEFVYNTTPIILPLVQNGALILRIPNGVNLHLGGFDVVALGSRDGLGPVGGGTASVVGLGAKVTSEGSYAYYSTAAANGGGLYTLYDVHLEGYSANGTHGGGAYMPQGNVRHYGTVTARATSGKAGILALNLATYELIGDLTVGKDGGAAQGMEASGSGQITVRRSRINIITNAGARVGDVYGSGTMRIAQSVVDLSVGPTNTGFRVMGGTTAAKIYLQDVTVLAGAIVQNANGSTIYLQGNTNLPTAYGAAYLRGLGMTVIDERPARNTDTVPEGATNLYHTPLRVLNTLGLTPAQVVSLDFARLAPLTITNGGNYPYQTLQEVVAGALYTDGLLSVYQDVNGAGVDLFDLVRVEGNGRLMYGDAANYFALTATGQIFNAQFQYTCILTPTLQNCNVYGSDFRGGVTYATNTVFSGLNRVLDNTTLIIGPGCTATLANISTVGTGRIIDARSVAYSPNGTAFRITVSDAGALSTVAL